MNLPIIERLMALYPVPGFTFSAEMTDVGIIATIYKDGKYYANRVLV